MKALPQTKFSAYYLHGLLALGIYGVWLIGNLINHQLALLPIREWINEAPVATEKPATAGAGDTQSLYPIWAKAETNRKTGRETSSAGELDALFTKKEENKPTAPASKATAPDYASLLKQMARLQSVADNGAVINGRFYAIGERITALSTVLSTPMSMPGDAGAPLVPVLAQVRSYGVTLKLGNARVSLSLQRTSN